MLPGKEMSSVILLFLLKCMCLKDLQKKTEWRQNKHENDNEALMLMAIISLKS